MRITNSLTTGTEVSGVGTAVATGLGVAVAVATGRGVGVAAGRGVAVGRGTGVGQTAAAVPETSASAASHLTDRSARRRT